MLEDIIFDLDGTLWDSRKALARAWSKVVKASPLGRGDISEADLAKVMGKQKDEISSILFYYLGEPERTKMIESCFEEEQVELLKYGGQLYPDLENVLEKLSQYYRLYIVSNCQEGYIETFYKYHNLQRFFTDEENAERTGLSKGENILLLMQRNNIQETVYVGDTQRDYEAAKIAGIPFVYASYGFGLPDDFNYKIEKPLDLIELFVYK